MADIISKTINTQIRKKLSDGTYQLEHPETTIENVLGKATKSDAEAGTSNSKYMTPLRVKDAIGEIGLKTSVFYYEEYVSSDESYKYIDVKIPLGKTPDKYVRMNSITSVDAGVYDHGVGEILIDILTNKIYVNELLVGNYYDKPKTGGNNDIIDGLNSDVGYVTFGQRTGIDDVRGRSISVDRDTLKWQFRVKGGSTLKLNNIIVEVL